MKKLLICFRKIPFSVTTTIVFLEIQLLIVPYLFFILIKFVKIVLMKGIFIVELTLSSVEQEEKATQIKYYRLYI